MKSGQYNFYPRPPRGGRHGPANRGHSRRRHFYPRPPRGGRPFSRLVPPSVSIFLSTSPAWGTTQVIQRQSGLACISIHVPRVGDDFHRLCVRAAGEYFYPRPPRGGRPVLTAARSRGKIFLSTSPAWGTTMAPCHLLTSIALFLSTSPAWGTTCTWPPGAWPLRNFYPRPPRGGRPKASAARSGCHCISIHVPRVGDDPRPSRKRRGRAYISIHVPRVGDDRAMGRYQCPDRHFYPRPPRGGRLWTTAHTRKRLNFYPRPPRGGRQKLASPTLTPAKFLSTSPAWGTTQGPV